jgi:adenylylsulfate reductase subunit A
MENLAAEGLHELMRCWENVHRMWQAEAHMRTILFREETRWPGYYFRADTPEMKEDWRVFVNATYKDGEWVMSKRPIHEMF